MDSFNSNFVLDYKEYFKVIISSQRNSMISIMQDQFEVEEDLIKIYPYSKENAIKTEVLLYDFNRAFFKELLEEDIDYLIIDNYLEVIMGILYVNNEIITNNVDDLAHTQFYKKLDDKFEFSIQNYPKEYFFIWTKYCDMFFKFLNLYRPNIRIILNKGRVAYKVLKNDGSVYIDEKFKEIAMTINPILDKLDNYIEENFDVDTFEFDFENTFIDANHLGLLSPVHYTTTFYESCIYNLVDIVDRDNSKSIIVPTKPIPLDEKFKNELHILNVQSKEFINNLRYQKLNYEYQKTKKLLNLVKDDENSLLSIYKTARIDFKNFGSEENSIKILENSDCKSNEVHPVWFKNDDGEGIFIESNKGWIDLKIKCIGDGQLKIWLRGPDVRDANNDMFPVFIDYSRCMINNELVFDHSELVWHDRAYMVEIDVSDSEILDVSLDWRPFNRLSDYKRKL